MYNLFDLMKQAVFSFQDKKYLILTVKSMEGECWPTWNWQISLNFLIKSIDILMFVGLIVQESVES